MALTGEDPVVALPLEVNEESNRSAWLFDVARILWPEGGGGGGNVGAPLMFGESLGVACARIGDGPWV